MLLPHLSPWTALFFAICSVAAPSPLIPQLTSQEGNERISGGRQAANVSDCPGYILSSVRERVTGLTAFLSLAGAPCNVFGRDLPDLTVEVDYETNQRLHVNIFDTEDEQYTIPRSVIASPAPPKNSFQHTSDLVFNFEPAPFAFWISRRSQPDAIPLFDTRISSLPAAPTGPVTVKGGDAVLDGFPLVFEDQYLQISSALPLDANVYGLGEVVASSGFRRDIGVRNGTIQTMWARDVADPVDENLYGSHPIYLEHRYDPLTKVAQSHGVFLRSAAGGDILLVTPPASNVSLIEYRMIGGVLDFYFLSGPSPIDVIEQYGELIGLPTWQPAWAFGFHLCRWGYENLAETKEQVVKMREANIPLEVMWNDIDLYHAVRDFTSDPISFPGNEMRDFIKELEKNHQHYIPILDAAIPKQANATDNYLPYTKGAEQQVFIKNPDGSEYIGQVWPGYTVFPDWFQKNTQQWWTESLRNWSLSGIEFDGIWLDMNEASSFCDGSCGTHANLNDTSLPIVLPGDPGNPVTDYPECYDAAVFGPSGNMTINGTSTCQQRKSPQSNAVLQARGLGAGRQEGVDLNVPPYPIHNGNGRLSIHALATNASHADGQAELDVHNLWGLMEAKATHLALQEIIPEKRPFLISRSTFPSSGKWSGHWLGDNFSLWAYLRYNIAGVLQFQLFQIPFVGADTCGFNGNTDEELCNRWMQLSAFTPFFRNHNVRGAIPQEPYRWATVAETSRIVLELRYSLLPYWYTLFANASIRGTPPVRALFFEFPAEPELFSIDEQFMVGRDLLITPVLRPNVSSVTGIFPGRGSIVWRDWYTHDVVNATGWVDLEAPLHRINVHIREGAAILMHSKPAYTIEETRQGPFSLLVSLTQEGTAFGTAYLDDGISYPPGPNKTVTFSIRDRQLSIAAGGAFEVQQKLQSVTILGVNPRPKMVRVNGLVVKDWAYIPQQAELIVSRLEGDLNGALSLSWNSSV